MKRQNKLEISEYRPPVEIVDVAERRAMDIYRQWAWNPRNDIRTLVVSLYLQGANDVIDSI